MSDIAFSLTLTFKWSPFSWKFVFRLFVFSVCKNSYHTYAEQFVNVVYL